MSRFLITGLIASIIVFVPAQDDVAITEIFRNYDPQKNVTTVALLPIKLSGPTDRYHTVALWIDYSYPGRVPSPPKNVKLEIFSVVKARRLNPDLYVQFVVDGKPMHFGSNRRAVRNPIPGKPWVEERMVFQIPREDFIKFATAKKLSVKLGAASFDLTDTQITILQGFIDPASFPSAPQQISPHLLSSVPTSAGYRGTRSR